MRSYTVYTRRADGALHPLSDHSARDAISALMAHRQLYPTDRGPFVVLPFLTAAPLCVD